MAVQAFWVESLRSRTIASRRGRSAAERNSKFGTGRPSSSTVMSVGDRLGMGRLFRSVATRVRRTSLTRFHKSIVDSSAEPGTSRSRERASRASLCLTPWPSARGAEAFCATTNVSNEWTQPRGLRARWPADRRRDAEDMPFAPKHPRGWGESRRGGRYGAPIPLRSTLIG